MPRIGFVFRRSLELVAGYGAVFGFATNGLTEICHDRGLISPV